MISNCCDSNKWQFNSVVTLKRTTKARTMLNILLAITHYKCVIKESWRISIWIRIYFYFTSVVWNLSVLGIRNYLHFESYYGMPVHLLLLPCMNCIHLIILWAFSWHYFVKDLPAYCVLNVRIKIAIGKKVLFEIDLKNLKRIVIINFTCKYVMLCPYVYDNFLSTGQFPMRTQFP